MAKLHPTKRWTEDEDIELARLYQDCRKPYAEIAKLMNRPLGSIGSRLQSLGLQRNKTTETESRGIITHPQPGVTVHLASYRYNK